jgi:hypothetical protein
MGKLIVDLTYGFESVALNSLLCLVLFGIATCSLCA